MPNEASNMAELVLEIANVTEKSTTSITKLQKLGQSSDEATKDADQIVTNLELLQDTLSDLEQLLEKHPNVHSSKASVILWFVLARCNDIYRKVDESIAPLLSVADQDAKWPFEQQDKCLLLAQLETIKSTVQVMFSVLTLAEILQSQQKLTTHSTEDMSSLRRNLKSVRESVVINQKALQSLKVEEEKAASADAPSAQVSIAQSSGLASWLENLVTPRSYDLNDDQGCTRRSRSSILSAKQRIVTGTESEIVEHLLENWTVLKESQSKVIGLKVRSSKSSDIASRDVSSQSGAFQYLNEITIKGSNSEGTVKTSYMKATTTVPDSQSLNDRNEDAVEVSTSVSLSEDAHTRDGIVKVSTENMVLAISNVKTDRMMLAASLPEREPTAQRAAVIREPLTFTEAWLELCEPDETESGDEEEVNMAFGGTRGAFSDFALLENTSSRAPSITTYMSSVQGPNDPRRAQKWIHLGKQMVKEKSLFGALDMFQRAYRAKDNLSEKEVCQLEYNFGCIYAEMKNFALAEKILRRALRTQSEFAMNIEMIRETQHALARTLARQKKWQRASQLYHHLWKGRRGSLDNAESTASSIRSAIRTGQEYCRVLVELQKTNEATPILEYVLPKAVDFHCLPDHKVVLDILVDTGRAYSLNGRYQDAKPILQDLWVKIRNKPGMEHVKAMSSFELAVIAYHEQRYEETLQHAHNASQMFRSLGQSDNPDRIHSARYIAMAETKLGKFQDALSGLENLRLELVGLDKPNQRLIIQIDADRAELLLFLKQESSAKQILLEAFEAMQHQMPIGQPKCEQTSLKVLEQLGPLILRSASNKSLRSQIQLELKTAQPVYERLYAQHRLTHGNESRISLDTGHIYGSLCFSIKELSVAEIVLSEVWSSRKAILGTDNSLTMQSGLQLSQVLHANNKMNDALTTVKSIFDLSQALTDRGSIEVIESAELLAFWCMSTTGRNSLSQDALKYIKAAFRARNALFGPDKDTCNAAVKVAVMSLARNDLQQSQEMFDYVFQQAVPYSLTNGPRKFAIMFCGLSSTAIAYLNDRETGNNLMERVIARAAKLYNEASSPTRSLRNMYAFLLFLQNQSKRSIRILRKIYRQWRQDGSTHCNRKSSPGVLLSLALIAESLVTGRPIPDEVDTIDDEVGQYSSTTSDLIKLSLVIAYFLADSNLKDLSHRLLKWIYKRQKKKFGRFSRNSVIVLAFIHSQTSSRLWRRARGTIQDNDSSKKLTNVLEQIWDSFTVYIKRRVSKLGDAERRRPFIMPMFAQQVGKNHLWKIFNREMLNTFPVYGTFLAREGLADNRRETGDEDDSIGESPFNKSNMPAQPVVVDDDILSRIWTINSDDVEDNDVQDDDVPFDLTEILGPTRDDDVSSFAGSLVDFMSARDEDFERARNNIGRLSSQLIDENVSDQDIDDARSNLEFLDREIDDSE